jgi:biotin synthase
MISTRRCGAVDLTTGRDLQKRDILRWLRTENPRELEELWRAADAVRKQSVGDAVHLRGLLEISNHCIRRCGYCGLNAGNRELTRYRMGKEEVLACVATAVEYGYGTVVMQAGEDYGIARDWLAGIVRQIKQETNLAVTLSMGERPIDDLKAWRQAGADRYLLRFETSSPSLYERVHPSDGGQRPGRIELLKILRELGYEIGSGVMIGIPGQSLESLADDILLFRTLDLDMIGVGPFIPHPQTVLGSSDSPAAPDADQVPNTESMVYKVIALARLVCPQANIPSTTALATINTETGRENGLSRGANVVMPNLTPTKYRKLYEIYPGKACINETAVQCRHCLESRIGSIGRRVGQGPGSRAGRANERIANGS